MSTLRITNIEAKADPSSPTVDEKIKLTNSNGDILVHIDGKTSGITTIGINTTAGNIKFDQNSNVVVTGIITATKFVGIIEPTTLTVGGDLTIPDKIVHTGDTNTSIRFPAADTITAETGGSERFKVTDSLKEVKNGNLRITSTYIDFSGDVSTPTTAAAIFRPADNTLAFSTGNNERLRITSAGIVRIPDNGKLTCGAGDDLQIFHNGSHSFIENNTGELLIRAKSGENSINCNPDGSVELFHDNAKRFETISLGTQTSGRVYLNGTNGGLDYNNTAHTLEYLVNGSTHSELNTGAYVPAGTKNLGSNPARWQTLYLSNGIDFGSTSDASGMTSEVLDDYEEGTWTPTITGLGNHNNTGGSTWGKYTKIGNRVFITWRYSWTSRTTTNGGVIFLGSLPFSSTNDSRSDAVYIGGLEGVISNTGREVYGGQVVYNTNTIQFRASGHNVSENSLFGSLSTSMSSGYIYGGANYIV